jgi:Iron dependent repressor, N-terminal DNA binding domain
MDKITGGWEERDWCLAVKKDRRLTVNAYAVLTVLMKFRNHKTGRGFVKVDVIAELLDISPSTVKRALVELRKAELVKTSPRHDQSGHRWATNFVIFDENLRVTGEPVEAAPKGQIKPRLRVTGDLSITPSKKTPSITEKGSKEGTTQIVRSGTLPNDPKVLRWKMKQLERGIAKIDAMLAQCQPGPVGSYKRDEDKRVELLQYRKEAASKLSYLRSLRGNPIREVRRPLASEASRRL